MALTKEDLQAIGNLIDDKLSKAIDPINKRLDRIEERSKQAAIKRQQERAIDKAELKAHTDNSIKKLKAKFK